MKVQLINPNTSAPVAAKIAAAARAVAVFATPLPRTFAGRYARWPA